MTLSTPNPLCPGFHPTGAALPAGMQVCTGSMEQGEAPGQRQGERPDPLCCWLLLTPSQYIHHRLIPLTPLTYDDLWCHPQRSQRLVPDPHGYDAVLQYLPQEPQRSKQVKGAVAWVSFPVTTPSPPGVWPHGPTTTGPRSTSLAFGGLQGNVFLASDRSSPLQSQ